MIRTFLVTSLLTLGLSGFQTRQAQSQLIWRIFNTPKKNRLRWSGRTINDSEETDKSPRREIVPQTDDKIRAYDCDLGGTWLKMKI